MTAKETPRDTPLSEPADQTTHLQRSTWRERWVRTCGDVPGRRCPFDGGRLPGPASEPEEKPGFQFSEQGSVDGAPSASDGSGDGGRSVGRRPGHSRITSGAETLASHSSHSVAHERPPRQFCRGRLRQLGSILPPTPRQEQKPRNGSIGLRKAGRTFCGWRTCLSIRATQTPSLGPEMLAPLQKKALAEGGRPRSATRLASLGILAMQASIR